MAQDDIQGQVVDAQGNPVSGAIVELTKSYQSSPLDEQVVRRTTTDANGNYIFEFHPDGDGTTQEWHVSCYNYDGTAYVNSFNNPGVTADLPSNAILASGLDHIHLSQNLDAADPWLDEGGSNDATAQGNPTLVPSGINGYQSVDLDGDDYYTASTVATGASTSFTVVAVIDADALSANAAIVSNGETNGHRLSYNDSVGAWEIGANGIGSVTGGSPDTNPHVLVGTYDGSTAILDVDGAEVINASLGSPTTPSAGFSIGAYPSGVAPLNGLIGAAGHEAGAADASRRDELTQILADLFDIAVSV